jgi:uncharacterized membrane protein YccC
MESNYIEEKRYQDVRKKVNEMRKFYEHLTIFILLSIILIVINLVTSPGYLWFMWCLLGGGIGVIIHGLLAFGISPILNSDWEERKIRKLLEKESLTNKNLK